MSFTEAIFHLAFQFWQFTILILLIIIGWVINMFDKKIDNRVDFKYNEYPHMRPIKIATKDNFLTLLAKLPSSAPYFPL